MFREKTSQRHIAMNLSLTNWHLIIFKNNVDIKIKQKAQYMLIKKSMIPQPSTQRERPFLTNHFSESGPWKTSS